MIQRKGFTFNIRIVIFLALALMTAVLLITVPKGHAEETTQRGTESIENASGAEQVSRDQTLINPGFEVSGQGGWTCFGDEARQGVPDSCVYFPSQSFDPSVDPQEGRNVGYVSHGEGACGIHGFGQRVVVPETTTTLEFQMKTELALGREAGVYILDADGSLMESRVNENTGSRTATTSAWEEKQVDLSGSVGDEVQIIVGNAETGSDCDRGGQYKIWVDDFSFAIN